MFMAEMMVCGFLQMQCMLMQDSRGLHFTQRECIERLEEMVTAMVKVVPQFELKAVRCNKVEGAKT